jgi:hypothetical protein
MCLHPSVSLNNETFVVKLVKIKSQFEENCGSTVQDVFGFELSVFESVSSHKNISVPRRTYLMKIVF